MEQQERVKILTINQVAEILQCSKAHVSNVINGRVRDLPRLPHFSMGRRKLVRREWLDAWLEEYKCQW
jgi:excisionase family DNA binding protein